MELNSIRQLTLKLMREHGLSDWTFKWGDFVDDLAKCNYKYKSNFKKLVEACGSV